MSIRTRFAPSPTGYIHIGNLRTALFSYLIAKKNGGQFILRIEDTDQNRSDKKFEEYIYKALKDLGLEYDEGPDKGGNYGPYRQSERKAIYLKYAQELVEMGEAYYCFCDKDNDENCHCRDLDDEQVAKLAKDHSYVIRQKIPRNQTVVYYDQVYGKLEFDSNVLDDQILIKSDGYPTYNFANVIDDHKMEITHVVRGNEYLSSTPKYVLLYQAFGWQIPKFVHLPIINIIGEDGVERKLSKRDGCSSFDNLIKEGYLKEAIINYIMFLGWNPKTNQEIFSLEQLEKNFSIKQLNKSSSVLFDEKKLNWFNHYYISKLDDATLTKYCEEWTGYKGNGVLWKKCLPFIRGCKDIATLKDIDKHTYYILNPNLDYDKKLLNDYDNGFISDERIIQFISALEYALGGQIAAQDYYNTIKSICKPNTAAPTATGLYFGEAMHVFRVAMSGLKYITVTGVDVAELIGIKEVKRRINIAKDKISNNG